MALRDDLLAHRHWALQLPAPVTFVLLNPQQLEDFQRFQEVDREMKLLTVDKEAIYFPGPPPQYIYPLGFAEQAFRDHEKFQVLMDEILAGLIQRLGIPAALPRALVPRND